MEEGRSEAHGLDPERISGWRGRVAPLRLSGSLLLATACVVLLLCSLSSTSALAARGHVFGFYFGSDVNKTAEEEGRTSEEEVCPDPSHPSDKCQPGTLGSGAGQFHQAEAVAINEAQRYVYVADGERVERFSSAGEYETEFNGSGENAWEVKAAPTGRVYLIAGVAVDNDHSSPSYGDVYVADGGNKAIDKFSASGEYLYQITEAPPGTLLGSGSGCVFCGVFGVAVDPSGGLWIHDETDEFDLAYRFNDALANQFSEEVLLGNGKPNHAGAAVDARDDIFVIGEFARASSHYDQVNEFDASGELIREAVGGVVRETYPVTEEERSAPTAVAVEASSGDVYVTSAEAVSHVTGDNIAVETLGEGRLSEARGVAADSAAQTVYVADAGANRVAVFDPEPPAAPIVSGVSVISVGAEDAVVSATVNPRSETGEPETEVEVEYGPCPSLAGCATSPYGQAVAGAKLAPDFERHAVEVRLAGLSPHTVYHFRVVASNKHGSATSEEATLTTQPSGLEFSLPDNRAWELVSPPNKHGALISGIGGGLVEAAADGSEISYVASSAVEEEAQGNRLLAAQTLSRRSGSGWATQEIVAPNRQFTGFPVGAPFEYYLFSSDLSLGVMEPSVHNPLLAPEASAWTPYLRHDFASSTQTCPVQPSACWTALVTSKEGYADVSSSARFSNANGEPNFGVAGATASLGDVVVHNEETGALFEWSGGEPWSKRLKTVGVLPAGKGGANVECATGGNAYLANSEDFGMGNAISGNGSRVFFEVNPERESTAPNNTSCGVIELQRHLYMRDVPEGESVRLDVVQPGVKQVEREAETPEPAFQAASVDGSRIFFTDTQRLTESSGTGDLYLCEVTVNASTGPLECALTDLTPKNKSGENAEVQGRVLGTGEEGEYVYFVAKSVLQGSGENQAGQSAQPRGLNLYMIRGTSTKFIATLSTKDDSDWSAHTGTNGSTNIAATSRVSPNGRWLAFMSQGPLTGYDNRDVKNGERDQEVYLYNGETGKLACASCNPTGARPEGEAVENAAIVNDYEFGPWRERWVAATVPSLTRVTLQTAPYQSRYLSDSGRLFFDARDPLVPQAKNHTWDVYEYEPPGSSETPASDSCTTSASAYSERNGGCVSLISSGSDEHESAFLDASESGDDVFFLTAAKLAPREDYDSAYDIYDAHACTAESPCITEPAEPTPCTTTDSCREASAQQPSVFGPPPSATFSGAGDLAPPVSKLAVKAKSLTRAQRLTRALQTCRRMRNRKKRAACARQARRHYRARKSRAGKSRKAAASRRGRR